MSESPTISESMVECPHCGDLRKAAGLKRHIWRSHTEEGRSHIGFRKGTHDQATRDVLSEKRKLQPSPFLGKTHPVAGKTLEEIHGSERADEIRSKMSEAMNGNRNGKQRKDRTWTYKCLRMDSGWEVGTAAYLDAQGVEWKHEERRFLLSDGRYYHPDFSIFNDGVFSHLIEVKGWFRPESLIKFALFQKDHPGVCIEVWDRAVLQSKGIINGKQRVMPELLAQAIAA